MSQKVKEKVRKHEAGDLAFGTRNYGALAAAMVAIGLGFWLLARGSITAAPVLLVLGYCVLVPYGLAAGRAGEPPPSGE